MFDFLGRRIFTIVAACFIAGIVAADLLPVTRNTLAISFAAVALFAVAAAVAIRARSTAVYALLFASCAALGASRLWFERESVSNQPLRTIVEANQGTHRFTGRVVGFPLFGGEYVRTAVSVATVDGVRGTEPLGRLMLFWKSDGAVDLTLGDTITFTAAARIASRPRNPGEFDYRSYLLDRGTSVTAFAFGARAIRQTGARSAMMKLHARVRARLMQSLAEGQNQPYSSLLVSLIYGDKTTVLDPQVKEEFRRAGMTHILVVSGTQVSLIVFLLIGMLAPGADDIARRGALSRLGAGAAIIAAVFIYCTLTGFETSVVRAFAMGVVMLVARLTHRESDGMGELSRSALVILSVQPGQLFGASFQLSFAACFGLLYVYSILGVFINRHRNRIFRYFLATLVTTGGAQLFVIPILAEHFNQFSFWGLPANLIAIPISSAILVAGVFHNVIGLLGFELVNRISVFVLSMGLRALCATADFFGNLPGSDLRIATPAWYVTALFYLIVFAAFELIRRRREFVAFASELAAIRPRSLHRLCLLLRAYSGVAMPSSIAVVAIPLLVISAWQSRITRPSLTILAFGDGFACTITDDAEHTFAIVSPAGGERVKRNQIRSLMGVFDSRGALPDHVFLLAEPGTAGEAEFGDRLRSRIAKFYENTPADEVVSQQPDGSASGNAADAARFETLFTTAGMSIAMVNPGEWHRERTAFILTTVSSVTYILIGDFSQRSISGILSDFRLPDNVIARERTIANFVMAMSGIGDARAPDFVEYGDDMDSAVEIELSADDRQNR